MKNQFIIATYLLFITSACSFAQPEKERRVGDGCEDCELMLEGMPATLASRTSLAGLDEKGERMVIRGTVFQKNGKTPASDVIVYFYHTDINGEYTPAADQTQGKRHGHLRGWIKTGKDGTYEIKSIRPASYPNGRNPQHIHAIVKEKNTSLYWIDDYYFDDDPYLDQNQRSHQQKRGGMGIITLKKNRAGIWEGKRDLILGLNIPGY
jgi:protocatechuate 3,4-dioxygenase beta subunit